MPVPAGSVVVLGCASVVADVVDVLGDSDGAVKAGLVTGGSVEQEVKRDASAATAVPRVRFMIRVPCSAVPRGWLRASSSLAETERLAILLSPRAFCSDALCLNHPSPLMLVPVASSKVARVNPKGGGGEKFSGEVSAARPRSSRMSRRMGA